MEKQKKMPQLRFPEVGENEWVKVELGDITTFLDGKRKPIKESDRAKIQGKYPYYGASGIIDYVNDYIFDEELVLLGEDGANILTRSLPLAFRVSGKCWINNHAHVIKPNSTIDIDFLTISLERISYEKYNTGTAQAKLNQEVCLTIPLNLPPLPEQRKIASFFTAIDQKISQLKRKKTLLEKYKKGVMQKIFSQEIRFKDDNGQEFPKWEKKYFGDVYSFKNNNSYSRENLNYEKGGVKNIHYGDIHTKLNTWFDITKEEIPYINEDLPIERISADNYCKEGDLVFADASEDLTDVGKSIELVNLNNEKVLSGLHTILARPDLSRIAIGFGGYLVKSIDVRTQIMKEAQGSKVSSISAKKLSGVQLNIPIPDEQAKIANFLSAIDDKIDFTQKQIEKAEVWKKGLMQQMFV